MLKNLILFRIGADWNKPSLSALDEALRERPFVPCGPTQTMSLGWVEPRGERHGALAEMVDGQIIVKLKVDTKSVPASVVKEKLDEAIEKMEQETGRKPGSKMKKEMKEQIVHDLLPHAFSKKSATVAWIDPVSKLLVVDAGSVSKADVVVSALIEAMAAAGADMSVRMVQSKLAPATAMATWLSEQEAPYNFTVDRECELKQPDTSKSTVRYVHHTLEIDEIREHIKQGKMPTKLALTWSGRVSFILTDGLALKKVEILDGVLDSKGDEEVGDAFDANVTIFTGELRKLLPDLVDALDGELVEAGGATAGADAGGGTSAGNGVDASRVCAESETRDFKARSGDVSVTFQTGPQGLEVLSVD